MNITATNNQGGSQVDIGITAEHDDGVFLDIDLRDFESGDEILDLIITDPNEVDALEQAVTEAVTRFREMRGG